MVEVAWTKKASGQLERAVKYIKEEQGVFYAEIVLNKILNSTRLLSTSPKMGTTEPLLEHKKSEYRYLGISLERGENLKRIGFLHFLGILIVSPASNEMIR